MITAVCHGVKRIDPVVLDAGTPYVEHVELRMVSRHANGSCVTLWAVHGESDERLRRYADAIAAVNRDMDAAERRAALALVPEEVA